MGVHVEGVVSYALGEFVLRLHHRSLSGRPMIISPLRGTVR